MKIVDKQWDEMPMQQRTLMAKAKNLAERIRPRIEAADPGVVRSARCGDGETVRPGSHGGDGGDGRLSLGRTSGRHAERSAEGGRDPTAR
jgi:hypothetical protein